MENEAEKTFNDITTGLIDSQFDKFKKTEEYNLFLDACSAAGTPCNEEEARQAFRELVMENSMTQALKIHNEREIEKNIIGA